MISLNLNHIENHVFSGGEVHVNMKDCYPNKVLINASLATSNDVMKLLMATDAIKRMGCSKIQLSMHYLPYSRQDRICNPGEALGIKVFADLINSQNYEKVFILDPHSDVGPALLNNCEIINNHMFIFNVLVDIAKQHDTEFNDFIIISPDAGSNKKIKDLMQFLNGNGTMVKCDKTRNVKTGELTGFEVYTDDLKNKACIIVDDICDGGGTFIGLAKELAKKNCGPLYLAVSHGIFSKGFEQLNKHFSKIYTTRSFPGKRDENLVIELNTY